MIAIHKHGLSFTVVDIKYEECVLSCRNGEIKLFNLLPV